MAKLSREVRHVVLIQEGWGRTSYQTRMLRRCFNSFRKLWRAGWLILGMMEQERLEMMWQEDDSTADSRSDLDRDQFQPDAADVEANPDPELWPSTDDGF